MPVPPDLGADVATLAEPTSVAVRALRKVAYPIGSNLLVVGAGSIGFLLVQVARTSGAGTIVVVDTNPKRRELALSMGADLAPAPDELEELLPEATGGVGPDVVFECSEVPGLAGEAIRLLRRDGTVVLVGFHGEEEPFDLLDAVLGEKRIVGSAAHLWDEDVATTVDLLSSSRVDGEPLLTTRVSLERIEEGFATLKDSTAGALKVLVTPGATHS